MLLLHVVYMNASRLQGFRVFDVDGRLLLYILIAASAAGLDEIRWLSPYSHYGLYVQELIQVYQVTVLPVVVINIGMDNLESDTAG